MKDINNVIHQYGVWKLNGRIGRVGFFINSLVLGALFGASFNLLLLVPSPVSPSSGSLNSLLNLGAYGLLLLSICGAIAVLITGLQVLYIGLFYATIIIIGPLSGADSSGSFFSTAISLLLGAILGLLLVFAYGNITKRLRDMGVQNVHMCGALICFLSAIPIIGSISYLSLMIVPTIRDIQSRFRLLTIITSAIFIISVFLFGPSLLQFVFAPYLIQYDLTKVLQSPLKYRHLNIANKKLGKLPNEIVSLKNLESLNASGNNLSSLPNQFSSLNKMKHLYMVNNKFTAFPSEIYTFRDLERLDLSRNILTDLPSDIGQLTNLTYLNLDKNSLKQLPKGISQLSRLKFIDIRNNPINKIPSEILELTELRTLRVNDDNLSLESKKILNQFPIGVVRYGH